MNKVYFKLSLFDTSWFLEISWQDGKVGMFKGLLWENEAKNKHEILHIDTFQWVASYVWGLMC